MGVLAPRMFEAAASAAEFGAPRRREACPQDRPQPMSARALTAMRPNQVTETE